MSKSYFRQFTLYDMEDSERLLTIGTSKEIGEYLNISPGRVRNAAYSGSLVGRRYKIEMIEEEEENDE